MDDHDSESFVTDEEANDDREEEEDEIFEEGELWSDRMTRLESEQEELNSSLIALTSHFAQVQLRLKQIVDASPEEKEQLLKDLEEFAFRGIPNDRPPQIEYGKVLFKYFVS